MKPRNGSLIKTSQTDHGGKKMQITNIRTKRGDITTNRTHITRTTKEYYKQLYHTNSTTFMRWTNSLKTTNYQKSPKLNLGGIEGIYLRRLSRLYSGPLPAPSMLFLQPQAEFSSP